MVVTPLLQENLGRSTSTGEMTYCFIQAIERGYGTTYGSLLNAMRSAIHMAENQLVTSLIDMLLKGGSYEGGDTPVSDSLWHLTRSCSHSAIRSGCLTV